MNVISQARNSAAVHASQRVPALRANALFTQDQLSQANFFAGLPQHAQAVVNHLEPYANRGPLDQELAALLRKARATVNRKSRFMMH